MIFFSSTCVHKQCEGGGGGGGTARFVGIVKLLFMMVVGLSGLWWFNTVVSDHEYLYGAFCNYAGARDLLFPRFLPTICTACTKQNCTSRAQYTCTTYTHNTHTQHTHTTHTHNTPHTHTTHHIHTQHTHTTHTQHTHTTHTTHTHTQHTHNTHNTHTTYTTHTHNTHTHTTHTLARNIPPRAIMQTHTHTGYFPFSMLFRSVGVPKSPR